jgi:cell division protein FtsW
MARRTTFDQLLFFPPLLLVVGGLFMVGSSSNYFALKFGMNPSSFYVKQGLYVLMGLGALMAAAAVPYHKLNRRSLVWLALPVLLVMLIVVLAMPSAGGAHRWIQLGPLRLQPSEFAKLFVVLFMAHILSRKHDRVNDLWSVLIPCASVLGALAFLIYIEPDLGSAVMLLVVGCVMLFAAGLRWSYVGATVTLGALGVLVGIVAEPFRWERIKAWVALWRNPTGQHLGANFQLDQSLVAIGSGGLTGAGLGHGQQKAYYVPAAHTDFIFSVVGEELGLLGTGTLLVAFLLICARRTASDPTWHWGSPACW